VTPAPPGHVPSPGDGWVQCGCGERHWGLFGAAGLLVTRRDDEGRATHVLLQHRAPWSHHGGTWGIPGGARRPGEPATHAALREAAEEAGVPAGAVETVHEHVLTHPDWTYTTVLAELVVPFDARPTDDESLAIAWVPVADVAALPLLPAFATAWPDLDPSTPGPRPGGQVPARRSSRRRPGG